MELSTDWELDTPVPSWLQKTMELHKLLISQTDPPERFESTKERILDLQATFSTALNIGHPKNDWTVLEPIAERCLQSLSRNPNNNTIPFAFIEEVDYLDKDVSHILELARYTSAFCYFAYTSSFERLVPHFFAIGCEMLAKGIPNEKTRKEILIFSLKDTYFHVLMTSLVATCRFYYHSYVPFIVDNNTNYFSNKWRNGV
nr:11908_t:CDS:2 [Entrophospora candida]